MITLLNGKDWSSAKQDRTQASSTIHFEPIVSRKYFWWDLKKSYTRRFCVTSTTTENSLQRCLNVWFVFWCRWKQQRYPTNPTRNQNPVIKYGEICMWTWFHTALRVDSYTFWRISNRYGEIRVGGSKRGARNWFQSARTVTCSCERSRTSPSSRACEKDRKSSSSRSISCRFAAE